MPRADVFDAFHGDDIRDFEALAQAGVKGVIHKASQGIAMRDPSYLARRDRARAAGLLWGAYHFGTGDDVESQVALFLAQARPDDATLLCLDWEPNGRSTMSLDQARQFVELVHARTGRWPVLYTGSLAKERLPRGGDAVLSNCRLWLSQYGPRAKSPPGWREAWLWQFTGDGIGPGPHELPGVATTGIDISQAARPETLAAEWAGGDVSAMAGAVGTGQPKRQEKSHDGAVLDGWQPREVTRLTDSTTAQTGGGITASSVPQYGIAVANVAQRSQTAREFILNLLAEPLFWTASMALFGGIYVILERRTKLLQSLHT